MSKRRVLTKCPCMRAGAAWSHAGWTLHEWDCAARTRWAASGLARDVALDHIQAHASQPPVYLWWPHAASGAAAAHDETAALRAPLRALFAGRRAAVRAVAGPAEAFQATVQRLIEGEVLQHDGSAAAGEQAMAARGMEWATIPPGMAAAKSLFATIVAWSSVDLTNMAWALDVSTIPHACQRTLALQAFSASWCCTARQPIWAW